MLTEIKTRGVNDVLMIVCDGLAGLPDAVTATWAQTITQTCVVHLLRNSFRYAGRQHFDAIAKALRPIYTAPTEAAAMERFLEFCEAWGERYPAIVRLWENAWAEFVPFLQLRRRDPQDRVHHQRDRVGQRPDPPRGQGPRALPQRGRRAQVRYMEIMSLDPTGTGRRRWAIRWKPALNAFDIAFDGRLSAGRK